MEYQANASGDAAEPEWLFSRCEIRKVLSGQKYQHRIFAYLKMQNQLKNEIYDVLSCAENR